MYRHFFKEVGRRLVAQGVLSSDEDVFFLTYDEVRAYLKRQPTNTWPGRVAVRRSLFEAFVALPDPPQTFLLSQGRVISTEPEPTGPREVLEGLPASPGRVTARARVIFDPADPSAQLVPGEILVAPFTDVGWTPLFLAAAGVVMTRGGPLSHSSIVAREYGIPAAVNVRGATELITTGDIITVDGDTGRVYLSKSI
jgi:pyruvate,water dikinase